MPTILDGKTTSQQILLDIKKRIAQHSGAPRPCLATILVGDDGASATYVRMKVKTCESVGMISKRIDLPKETTTQRLLEQIDRLNDDDSVHGILLQHPVPNQIDERKCFDRIRVDKDVDGVTAFGFGNVSLGSFGFMSCTPGGMMYLLKAYNIPIKGKHAVVVGRSPILGKPMAMYLLNEDATVTICHSKTVGLPELVRQADIVVGALGKPEFIKGEWIKEGAVVLDAGYNAGNVGDVDFKGASERASYITPVPGGVGPMTIGMLMLNTTDSWERAIAKKV